MSLHEAITTAMARYIEDRRDCAILSPSAVAAATLASFSTGETEPHIEYAGLEHFKIMGNHDKVAQAGFPGTP